MAMKLYRAKFELTETKIKIQENKETQMNKTPRFGLTIVSMLTEQLKGSYISENDHGNRSILTFTI